MSLKVVILNSAKQDLKEQRSYVVARLSDSVWSDTSMQLKKAMQLLSVTPYAGAVPEEIETLNLSEYRQIVSGKNRIIYEIRQEFVFIHAVIDVRRDMVSLLTKRLLRISH